MSVILKITNELSFEKKMEELGNPDIIDIFTCSLDEDTEIPILRNTAQQLNLKCLKYVNITPDVMFNHLQLNEIRKELILLQDHPDITKNIISCLQEALNIAKDNKNLYLHFEGL